MPEGNSTLSASSSAPSARLDGRPGRVARRGRSRTARRPSSPCRWNGAASTGPGASGAPCSAAGRPAWTARVEGPMLRRARRASASRSRRESSSSSEIAARGWSIRKPRKARSGTTRPRTSSSAVTEAERGWPSMPERSPSSSPGPRSASTSPRRRGRGRRRARGPSGRAARSRPCRPARRSRCRPGRCRARPCPRARRSRPGVSVWRNSASRTCAKASLPGGAPHRRHRCCCCSGSSRPPRPQPPPGWKPDVRGAARLRRRARAATSASPCGPSGAPGAGAGRRPYRSASVVKAMLLVAYLRRGDVRGRALRAASGRCSTRWSGAPTTARRTPSTRASGSPR